MNSFSYRFYRASSTLQHWFPRRFTRAGMLVFVFMVIAASFGSDMEKTVAVQGLAALMSMLLVSIAWASRFKSRVRVTRTLPRFATAGQPLEYRFDVENLEPNWLRGLEWFDELEDSPLSLAEYTKLRRHWNSTTRAFKSRVGSLPPWNSFRPAQSDSTRLDDLPPRGRTNGVASLTPNRRGMLRFEESVVARRDPFGLLRSFVRHPLPQSVLVLPRRYRLPDLELPGMKAFQRGGVALAASIGESDEFAALRDYRPGDPFRHIHWNSWARAGKPIVKEFQDEHFVRHALILDTLPPKGLSHDSASKGEWPDYETSVAFEESISVAASLICGIDTQESLLDLMFLGPRAIHLTTGRGVAQAEQALEYLAAAQLQPGGKFSELQTLVLNHAEGLCGCILVLLFWDDSRAELVRQLEQLRLPLMILAIETPDRGSSFPSLTSGGTRIAKLIPGDIETGLSQLGVHA